MYLQPPLLPRRGTTWLLIGLLACSGCWHPSVTTPGQTDFSQGDRDLMEGKLPDAIAQFDNAIKANPLHAKAVYYRAVAREKSNAPATELIADYSEAIRLHAEVVHDRDPNSIPLDSELPQAYCRRGELFYKLAQYDKAIDDFTAAIRCDSQSAAAGAAAYDGRGLAYLKKGFAALAIDDFSAAIRIDPDMADALRERARAFLAMGNHSVDAILDCQRAIQLNPKDAVAFNLLGQAHATSPRPDFERAIAAYKESIRLAPELATETDRRIADAYGSWSLGLQKAGDDLAAKEKLEQAVAFGATSMKSDTKESQQARSPGAGPQPYIVGMPITAPATAISPRIAPLDDQGFALLQQGQFDQAIAVFTQALQIDPRYYHSLYGRGMAYLEKGFANTAQVDFNVAIGMNKNAAEAYCQRSLADTMLGDYFHAAEDATEAIRIQPDLALAYYYRAIAYINSNAYQRAARDLAEATRLDPKFAEAPPAMLAQAFRGDSIRYLRNEQWTEAIDGLIAAIRLVPTWRNLLDPRLAEAYRGRGLERAGNRNYSLALRDFSDSIELQPADAKNYQARGLVYSNMRNWDCAIADFRQAIKLDPDLKYALDPAIADALRGRTSVTVPAVIGRTAL